MILYSPKGSLLKNFSHPTIILLAYSLYEETGLAD